MSAEDYPDFHDVRLERGYDYGARGGHAFSTDITTVKSGKEYRNIAWAQEKGSWQTGEREVTQAVLDYLIAFHKARRGRAYSFRLKEWGDYRASDEAFATGDGSKRTFQLTKTYSDDGGSYTRDIFLPIASEFSMTRTLPGGSAVAFNGYTLDPIGGTVSLDVGTSYAEITDLSAVASDSSFNSIGSDLSAFEVGDFVQVSGFYNDANNGAFKVATTSANKITVTDEDDNAVTLVDEGATSTRTITRAEFDDTGSDFAFTASTKTITRSSGNFGDLVAGETFTISGSTDNDGTFTVATVVSAQEITVDEALTDESAGASVTINRAQVQVSNTDIEVSSAGAFTSSGEDLSVFQPGAEVTTAGFFQGENNDTFTVDSAAANTLTVDETTTLEEVANPERTIEDEPSVPGAVFAWSGEFDQVVRFAQDEFEYRFDAYRSTPREAIFYLFSLECVVDRL
ncbi:DUF2460 domain-containing protein [Spectribacter hydrogenooxidans]|uniref:DUF2460 domain-containing protein n=1 Tax=Spectribacter hydrogenoxidans TaxID=3075608 RepID=A0ABU3C169_9GAMM|nr:DUF2460 domain-containing protein [Salinisphaera sp. W335]MDT0635104.1 DUF2460 domain-containing protein [Salinisphaera sp. W335]